MENQNFKAAHVIILGIKMCHDLRLVLGLPGRAPVSAAMHDTLHWRDMQSIDVTSRWREDWQSATVVNSTLVVDPTIRLPGFDLNRRQWSLLNRFRTGQGHCNACHKKWGFTDNEQ